MERLSGKDALKTYSFRDVTLPQDIALDVLTRNTLHVFKDNVAYIIAALNPHENEMRIKFQDDLQNSERVVGFGGVSLGSQQLNSIRDTWGGYTFNQVIRNYYVHIVPEYQKRRIHDRNAGRCLGVVSLGHVLDFLRIIDPQVSQFHEGVASIVESMRSSDNILFPFLLGIAVDDTIERRNKSKSRMKVITDIDVLADKVAAEHFRDAFRLTANSQEQEIFNIGYESTFEELTVMTDKAKFGFSRN